MSKPNSQQLMEQMAEEECFEYHGCFTGDCPHEKAQDCAKHFFTSGWQARDKVLLEAGKPVYDRAELSAQYFDIKSANAGFSDVAHAIALTRNVAEELTLHYEARIAKLEAEKAEFRLAWIEALKGGENE